MAEPRNRPNLSLALIIILILLVPLLLFYDTWLGRKMSPEQIKSALESGESHRVWQAVENLKDAVTTARERGKVPPEYVALFPIALGPAKSDDPKTRAAAAYIAGLMPEVHDAAIAVLSPLVKDPDRSVRIYAACSLANYDDATGRDELREVLANARSDDRALGNAAGALAYIGDATDLQRLESLYRRARDGGNSDLESFAAKAAETLKERLEKLQPVSRPPISR